MSNALATTTAAKATRPEFAKSSKKEHAECPACSCKTGWNISGQVHECTACHAVHGTCYLGDSYGFVTPFMVDREPAAETIRYFDFTTLGSKGVGRRHGWFDPQTKRIVQVG